MTSSQEHPTYNYKVVRQFTIMTVIWGIVGMTVGVLIAAQLVWPQLNFDTPWHPDDYVHRIGRTGRIGSVFHI